MPAQRLNPQFAVHNKPFDVVGQDHPTLTQFVAHLALFDEDSPRAVKDGDAVNVFHMGPPLANQQFLSVNVFGSAELKPAEIKKMRVWLDLVLTEKNRLSAPRLQYVARPHFEWGKNKKNGARRYRRFSCVGLVIECYAYIGIHLLDLDDLSLPDVPLSLLLNVYPAAGSPRIRLEIGLVGPGPYKVALPGHVMNSLNRSATEIRDPQKIYRALSADHLFP